MAVLVIGPSGVGKSSALKVAAAALPQYRFPSLDVIACELGRERGLIGPSDGINALRQRLKPDDAFLEFGRAAVEIRERQGGLLVVDVGAGFLDAPSVGDWLRRHTSVALVAPAEVVHSRIVQARGDKRSLPEYTAQEYPERRLALYNQATHRIDAACTPDEVSDRLVMLLQSTAATLERED